MAGNNVLALVLAGGAGGRMLPLTQVRAKPAMPYGGVYRLIDFPLSNCMHSRIPDVWVIEQYQPHSLNNHLAGGRPWDLDRTYGGLKFLQPYQGGEESGWHQGNADAVYKSRDLIRDFNPEILLVLSADHVYKLDYREVIERHRETGADVTMVTTQVPREQAGRFGVVQADGDGKVTGFQYKPDEPRSDIVTAEIFVYNAPRTLQMLEDLVEQTDGEGLEDYGDSLIPRLVEEGRAWEHRFNGYWMDVGVPASYWQSHMDLLAPEPRLDLQDQDWPILTRGTQLPPARIHSSARIEDSLISPGCDVRGRVVRSVLGQGVVVEEGAVVRDSVIFDDTKICAGAAVGCAILDKEIRIGERARVGKQGNNCSADDITIVGRWAQIPSGARIEPGDRVDPGPKR